MSASTTSSAKTTANPVALTDLQTQRCASPAEARARAIRVLNDSDAVPVGHIAGAPPVEDLWGIQQYASQFGTVTFNTPFIANPQSAAQQAAATYEQYRTRTTGARRAQR